MALPKSSDKVSPLIGEKTPQKHGVKTRRQEIYFTAEEDFV